MKEIPIRLGERSHVIHLGRGILSHLPEILENHKIPPRVALVTDRTVARLHLRPLRATLKRHGIEIVPIIIPPGEKQKSLERASGIIATMIDAGLTRSSAVIAFGGGVVGDVSGFVASTYRRGIPLIHIPTTLLAQIESAIGGKSAVNHRKSKNAIGAYHQPVFIFSDVQFLSTLPKREIICGLGEALKYAILDERIFAFLEDHLEDVCSLKLTILEELICLCNVVKARLVEEDERETNPRGGRAVLNLGHTIGHALELLSAYRLHHGEAVLIGLRWELEIARTAGIIDAAGYDRLHSLLGRVRFNPNLKSITTSKIVRYLYRNTGTPTFMLPHEAGIVTATKEIDCGMVASTLKKISR